MKNKLTLEYPMNCSPLVLYPRLSTPGGLSEWFADDVNVDGKYYAFIWDKVPQRAEVLQRRENSYIKFRWEEDEQDNIFFEFRIITDELTNENALVVTDFVEDAEKKEITDLWNSQISSLKRCIGV
ncbi:MAG: SRPBCC domain-containing protein [Bacteroidetes bacterium]|nr:SRPBCC domain-containing protein [Bacteroidota bacterium]